MSAVEVSRGVFSINYHIVLVTKNRKKVLVGPVKDYIRELILEIAASRELVVREIEVNPDQVRMTVSAGPMDSPYMIVKAIKNLTWSFMLLRHPALKESLSGGLWSSSYYVVTVEDVDRKAIDDYVSAQSENAIKVI